MDGYETRRTTLADDAGTARTHDVYVAGAGPAVIVIAEIPGITPDVRAFADRVVAHGMSVYLPSLFGVPGRAIGPASTTRALAEVCIAREFSLLASNASSPVVGWLRALARSAHEERGGPGVGAVGMCVTGNFALGMVLDAPVVAPVLAQPSLPVPVLPFLARGLHVSPRELDAVKGKVAREGLRVLGLRFEGDPLCPRARFDRLREELGEGFEAIELDPRHASLVHGTRAHSVLTTHLVDREGEPTRAALDRTLAFLAERLLGRKDAP